MSKRRFGGKRKHLEIQCKDCSRYFKWLSNGTAWEIFHKEPKPEEFIHLKFVGTRKEYWEHNTYKLTDFRCPCGGKLKRLSISNPVKKIVGTEKGYEVLECGHHQWPRSDIFGQTVATRRQCRECGRALRKEAYKQGNPSVNVNELFK